MSEATQAATPRPGRIARFLAMPTGTLLKRLVILAIVLALLAITAFAAFVLWPVSSIPPEEPIDEYVYLDQGWGKGADSVDRQTYYYTPQGTTVPQGALMTPVRYSWFVNLELPFSQQRFVDPDHMRRYRFIVDPHPTAARPCMPSPAWNAAPSARP